MEEATGVSHALLWIGGCAWPPSKGLGHSPETLSGRSESQPVQRDLLPNDPSRTRHRLEGGRIPSAGCPTSFPLRPPSFKKNFGCGISEAEKQKSKQAYSIIKSEYRALGRMKFSEAAVLILFITLVVLWFTREPGFMPGWANALFSQRGKR